MSSAYRHKLLLNNSDLNETRGVQYTDWVWDESACGSKLIIENNGKVVQARGAHQNVRTKIALENDAIFEWDVFIEKYCVYSWIGVCASEGFDYEKFAGDQHTGWVLGSNGSCFHSGNSVKYCPSFEGDNSKVTVHLDMKKRTCAFTVNGTIYPVVSEWNDLPSKLYPVVSLRSPGKFRIQSHQKI